IFSDIGKQREITECPYNGNGLLVAEMIEDGIEFIAGCFILIAPEAYGCLANGLDQIEHCFAFQLSYGISQHASQQTNIFPQRVIFFIGCAFLGNNVCSDIQTHYCVSPVIMDFWAGMKAQSSVTIRTGSGHARMAALPHIRISVMSSPKK